MMNKKSCSCCDPPVLLNSVPVRVKTSQDYPEVTEGTDSSRGWILKILIRENSCSGILSDQSITNYGLQHFQSTAHLLCDSFIPRRESSLLLSLHHFTFFCCRWRTSTVQLTTTTKMDLQRPLTLPGYPWRRKTHAGDNGVEWTQLNRICLHMFQWFFISTHLDPPPLETPLEKLSLLLKILSPPPKISAFLTVVTHWSI